jgi:hypothetical protein
VLGAAGSLITPLAANPPTTTGTTVSAHHGLILFLRWVAVMVVSLMGENDVGQLGFENWVRPVIAG